MRFFPGLWSLTLALAAVANMGNQVTARADTSSSSFTRSHERGLPGPDARTRVTTTLQSRTLQRVFQQTQAVIKRWKFPTALSISVSSSTHASAFVHQNRAIRVSEPLLDVLQSEEQIAFAISHEMAHIALGHTVKSGLAEELIADAFAVSILDEIGMNPCASAEALQALSAKEPLYREHLGQRLQHLQRTTLSQCSKHPPLRLSLRRSSIEPSVR